MARRRGRRPLVPGAGHGLDMLKAEVMQRAGYSVSRDRPDLVKYEVARSLGVPLQTANNGNYPPRRQAKSEAR